MALEVDLVAAAGKVWSGTARMVSAKAGDGEIGILAGTSRSSPCSSPARSAYVPRRGGEPMRWQVEGGFLSFDTTA